MHMLTHMSRRRFSPIVGRRRRRGVDLAAICDGRRRRQAPKLRLAVKYSMVRVPGASVQDKFELVKKIGFEGLEIQAPGELDLDEAVAASKSTGIKIHGVIDSVHWKGAFERPERRRTQARRRGFARSDSRGAKGRRRYVPARAGQGQRSEERKLRAMLGTSQAGVRECLKLAEECKVVIAIETVWNDFITKPEHMIRYVDEIASPWCGAYFDCSNMLKYGVSSADWIRQLGKRLVKFDFKGYSHATGFKTPIGEGDENWPEVLKALGEIGYDGWATSEVAGGGEKELTDIYQRMAKALGKA